MFRTKGLKCDTNSYLEGKSGVSGGVSKSPLFVTFDSRVAERPLKIILSHFQFYLPPLKLLHFPYWTSKIQYNLMKFTSFDVDFLIFQITKLQIFFAQSLCFCYLGPPVGVKAWKRHQAASLNHSFRWGAHRVRAAVAQIVLVVRKLLLVSEWWKVEGCETSNCWSELKGCYCCCQRFSWQQSYFKTKHL